MGKLYFVKTDYKPNTAPDNRFLSFVAGFSQLDVEVEVVFVLSDDKGSRITKQWPHITVTYLWDKLNIKNRYLRQLSYTLLARCFVNGLKEGDKVVLFDSQRMMFPLIKKNGVKVFVEKTEHPFAYHVRTINMKKYVEWCKHLDGMFVISTALRDYFGNHNVPSEKIHIINMTVDPQRFIGLTKQDVEHPYIAYCGTASNNKDGVDELIKAFAIVAEQHPNYRLFIIGKGLTKDDDSTNRQLVERLNLLDKIVFTGVVNAEEMPQLLKNATILALDRPNNLQAQYGFPTKLGEYLLTENPVVVTRVGDIPLFLKDGESALLSEPQNAEAFAAKLIWAIEHPVDASIIGKAGSEVAKKEFNCMIESRRMYKIINGSI